MITFKSNIDIVQRRYLLFLSRTFLTDKLNPEVAMCIDDILTTVESVKLITKSNWVQKIRKRTKHNYGS